MKSHEEKSTCASPRSFDQGDQENAHTGTAEAESSAVGGGEEKKVARKKPRKIAPFQGGERFGKLTVVSFSHSESGRSYWNCLCECGATKVIMRNSLTNGYNLSCGCWKRESTSQRFKTHGDTCTKRTPEFMSWCHLRARCEDMKSRRYRDYGGRGIKVCDRWRSSFENFLADMGRKPSAEHSIDRKDNDGDYTPENCRWATRKEQQRNQRRNRILTYAGESLLLVEWAERTGLSSTTIRARLRKGLSVEKALTIPYRKRKFV